MNAKKIIAYLEDQFPSSLAYEWDNVGLQVGNETIEVSKVLITLDVTIEVINEAIHMGANMIVAHHPMIFRPLKNIVTNDIFGQMISLLIKHDIVLYVMHTNYDISNQGMNSVLADKLGLKNQEIIDFTTEDEGLGKIGHIKEMSLDQFVTQVKQTFQVSHVRVIGDLKQMVSRVAIVGGSGSSVIEQAQSLGADVLITGDITYHHALDMRSNGLLGIDPGHHIEVVFVDAIMNQMVGHFPDLLVVKSKTNTDPYILL